jgi:methionyl-tRNA synthetase
MPETTEKLWSSIGAKATLGEIQNQKISEVANWGQLPAGSKVTKTDVLFPRLEESK